MTLDDEVKKTFPTSNDSNNFKSLDQKIDKDLNNNINTEINISDTNTINFSSCSCGKLNHTKKRINNKRLRKSKPKLVDINISHNKVKRVSNKAKSNFLNNFDIDQEQIQATINNSEKFISNFDIFQLRPNTSLQDDACSLRNIFQSNNSSISKLLPWEKSPKTKRFSFSKKKSPKTNNPASQAALKTMSNGLMLKESLSSKYNSFITIYDLSYRLREQKPYKASNDLKTHLLGNSDTKSFDTKSGVFLKDSSKDFENEQKLRNPVLGDDVSGKKSYQDIISRVLKSNISMIKSDLK